MTLLGRNFVEQIYKLKILPNRRRHYCKHVSSSILTQPKLNTNLENCKLLRQNQTLAEYIDNTIALQDSQNLYQTH